jgi:hypothetical protein
VSNVCATLTAHHKHKTSLIFSYIHKVQSFNVGTKTAKVGHRKTYKILFQRGQSLHEAKYLSILTVPLTSQGILYLAWNLNVANR